MSSKFREHLSISPPRPNSNIEKSKFSPASTISPTAFSSMTRKDLETGMSPSPSFRDRFTKMFFDVRTFSSRDSEIPIQEPHLSQWPPLHVQKRRCTCHHPELDKKKRNRRSWW